MGKEVWVGEGLNLKSCLVGHDTTYKRGHVIDLGQAASQLLYAECKAGSTPPLEQIQLQQHTKRRQMMC